MNALHGAIDVIREFLGNLDVFPGPRIGEMTAYECVELVSEDLVEHSEVLMKICRQIKSLERRIAGSYGVNRH
jgi:hypothetical protein